MSSESPVKRHKSAQCLACLRTERGYELTFRAPKDEAPPILDYDIPTFNHIILFAPDTKCESF